MKKISPPLGVIPWTFRPFYKDFTPSRVFQFIQTPTFRRKSFSPRLISSGGKMERMPMTCAMGLALECFLQNSPSKRRILKEDIPDNKAFFSCARGCAKSHLKWAEGFWLLLGSKSNKENAQALEIITRNYFTIRLNSSEPFGGALRVTHKGERKIFHPRCGLSVLLFRFLQIFHPFQGFYTNTILPQEVL